MSVGFSVQVALTNQLRRFLLEHELPVRVGSEHLWKTLPNLLEDGDNGLSGRFRTILLALREEWSELEAKISNVTEKSGVSPALMKDASV